MKRVWKPSFGSIVSSPELFVPLFCCVLFGLYCCFECPCIYVLILYESLLGDRIIHSILIKPKRVEFLSILENFFKKGLNCAIWL